MNLVHIFLTQPDLSIRPFLAYLLNIYYWL